MLILPYGTSAQQKPGFKFPVSNPFKDMLPADYCDVINHPQSYDGKLIRLRVIWYQMIEGAILYSYDSNCGETMRPSIDCPTEAACKPLRDQIWGSLGPRLIDVGGAMLLKGRLRYRRFVTRTDYRFGYGHYDFEVVGFEESLKLPEKPNEEGWPPDFLLRPHYNSLNLSGQESTIAECAGFRIAD